MRLERISARRNSLPQIAQQICELALDAAFVYVMVPTAAIEEGNFEANIRFEQFRDFPSNVARSDSSDTPHHFRADICPN